MDFVTLNVGPQTKACGNNQQRKSVSSTRSVLNVDEILKHVDVMDDIKEEEEEE